MNTKFNRIYHNPRCSKSRTTLELLNTHGVEVEIIDYLVQPPTSAEFDYMCKALAVPPMDLIRLKDKKYLELKISNPQNLSKDEWSALVRQHPHILQRPIVMIEGRVALGRPPENVLAII